MSFRCTLVTPERQMLDENARQVVLPAFDGQLGILTGRSPLLVKLGAGKLQVDLAGGKSSSFFVSGGVAQMKDNRLTILTELASDPADISGDAAKSELAAALATKAKTEAEQNYKTKSVDSARAKVRLAKR